MINFRFLNSFFISSSSRLLARLQESRMPKNISYDTELIESWKDSSEAAVYFEVVREEGDLMMIKKSKDVQKW